MSIRQEAALQALGAFVQERMDARALTVEDVSAASGIPKATIRRNLADPGQWTIVQLGYAGEAMGEACLPFTVAALEVYGMSLVFVENEAEPPDGNACRWNRADDPAPDPMRVPLTAVLDRAGETRMNVP